MTWELRAAFARAAGRHVRRARCPRTRRWWRSREVNADVVGRDGGDAERLGSIERVTAERHGAIRVGTPRELAQVARMFAALGMHPVGFYDLRDAGAERGAGRLDGVPADRRGRAGPQPVPGLHLDAGHRRPAVLRRRDLQRAAARRSWPRRELFPPELLDAGRPRRRRAAACRRRTRTRFLDLATAAFELSTEPVDRAWYDELERISAVAADIGGVPPTHINHLTPRVLDIDELYRADAGARHHDDRRDPGAAALGRPGRPAAADVVPRAGRGPRRSGDADGSVQRPARCGCASGRSRRAASR